jgi:hypothetical protein
LWSRRFQKKAVQFFGTVFNSFTETPFWLENKFAAGRGRMAWL